MIRRGQLGKIKYAWLNSTQGIYLKFIELNSDQDDQMILEFYR